MTEWPNSYPCLCVSVVKFLLSAQVHLSQKLAEVHRRGGGKARDYHSDIKTLISWGIVAIFVLSIPGCRCRASRSHQSSRNRKIHWRPSTGRWQRFFPCLSTPTHDCRVSKQYPP